ncbi:hypothetical protein TIFTF001_028180 [Ficus carica]|uniref:Uncharacterized protein n=1 Tax=Ficus carica TaxID=3494 RepID=A0AA88DPL0_FICCA|nr:hypothetical protein TIFTF001_028180 [Ficus carica]
MTRKTFRMNWRNGKNKRESSKRSRKISRSWKKISTRSYLTMEIGMRTPTFPPILWPSRQFSLN